MFMHQETELLCSVETNEHLKRVASTLNWQVCAVKDRRSEDNNPTFV